MQLNNGLVAEESESKNFEGSLPQQENIMDVDLESEMPMPGKGKKFMFKSFCNNKEISVLVDTGSSTTLVLKSLVINLNLKYYTSRLPINFLGMFGNKMVPDAKVASIVLDFGNNQIGMPAYIMDTLPSGIDLIIGTDQLGKSLGISIDLFNSSFISFNDSDNRLLTYRLGEALELLPVLNDSRTLLPVLSDSSNILPVIKDYSNTVCASKLSDNINNDTDKTENYTLSSNLESKDITGETVQKEVTLSSKVEKVVLPNERFIAVEIENRQVDPVLLSVKIEIENISAALETLQRDIEQLSSLTNFIPSGGRKSRSRSSNFLLFENERDNLILRFNELINSLKKELNRLKKKYHNKVTRRHKNDKRNKRNKMKAIKRSVNLIDQRYITPIEDKSQPPKVDSQGRTIFSATDIIETIIIVAY